MPAGRPRLISSPEEMQARINQYYADCIESGELINYEGMGLACGLCGREGLDEYGRRPEYSDIIKEAKAIVRKSWMRSGVEAKNPAMQIFILKNMGYSDRQDIALSTPDGALQIDPGRDRLTDEQITRLLALADGNLLTE